MLTQSARLQLVIQLIFGCNHEIIVEGTWIQELQLVIQLIFGCNTWTQTPVRVSTLVTVGDSTNIWL